MKQRILTADMILDFARHLRNEERAAATVEKYLRDTQEFAAWLDGRAVTKEAILTWREELLDRGRSPVTINAKLSALNGLL